MRTSILALTAMFLAPGAAMAAVPGAGLVSDSKLGTAAAVSREADSLPEGVATGQRGFMVLAKGDMSATGGGSGGQKGQKKGGHKGKQKEGKDNPNKQK